ncbi:N-acetyltransferase [Marinilabiliaceae bacterium JC017]|nr:N-acetyltransferase [Marinilabiliaceae bacterium JC017]
MIESEDICLRALEPEDVEMLYKWENDMKLWTVSNTHTPFSRHQLKRYIEHANLDLFQTKQLRLVIDICLEDKKTSIGLIDLFDFDPFHNRGGIGIIIHENYRGKGWAFKALETFILYCFEHLGLHQLYANISENNTPSIKLFESCGFEITGRKKQWRKTPQGYLDELLLQKINCK